MANSPTLPRRHGALGGGALTSGLTGDKRSQELLYALHAKTEVRHAISDYIEVEHVRWAQRLEEFEKIHHDRFDKLEDDVRRFHTEILTESVRTHTESLRSVREELIRQDILHRHEISIMEARFTNSLVILERRTLLGLCTWIGRTIKGWFK